MQMPRDRWFDAVVDSQSAHVRTRADEGRGSVVHPLHVGLDRQTQGRAAHHRRLPGVRQLHARVRVRPAAGRRVLVHGRCRLDHRPQLHRLRPAGQRRDAGAVRRRAELPGRVALLAGGRPPCGDDLLHRADRDPRADARRRRAGAGARRARRCACWARSASRSIRKPGAGITTSSATGAARSSIRGGRPKPAGS